MLRRQPRDVLSVLLPEPKAADVRGQDGFAELPQTWFRHEVEDSLPEFIERRDLPSGKIELVFSTDDADADADVAADDDDDDDADADEESGGDSEPTERGRVIAVSANRLETRWGPDSSDRNPLTDESRRIFAAAVDKIENSGKLDIDAVPEFLREFFLEAGTRVGKAIQGFCRYENHVIVPWKDVVRLREEGLVAVEEEDMISACGTRIMTREQAEQAIEDGAGESSFGLIEFDSESARLRGLVLCRDFESSQYADVVESINPEFPDRPSYDWKKSLVIEKLCAPKRHFRRGVAMLLACFAIDDGMTRGRKGVFMEVTQGTKLQGRPRNGFSNPLEMV